MVRSTKISIDVDAKTARFNRKMKKATKTTKKFRNAASAAMKATAAAGVAAGAAAVAFTAFILREGQRADKIAKTARMIGIQAESLQSLQIVAQKAGTTSEVLAKGLIKMQKSISDAGVGLSTAIRAFDQLGVSLEDIEKLDPESQFKAIADALNKVENETDRTRIAMDIFGRAGAELKNTMAIGSEGISELQDQFIQLGGAISDFDLKVIEDMNDAWLDMKVILTAFKNSVLVAVAPIFRKFFTDFVNARFAAGNFGKSVVRTTRDIAIFMAEMVDMGAAAVSTWKTMQLGFAVLTKMIIEKGTKAAVVVALLARKKPPEFLFDVLEVVEGIDDAIAELNGQIRDLDRSDIAGKTRKVFDELEKERKKALGAMQFDRAVSPDPFASGLFTGDLEDAKRKIKDFGSEGQRATSSVADGLMDVALGAKTAENAVEDLVRALARASAQRVITERLSPLISLGLGALGKFAGGLFAKSPIGGALDPSAGHLDLNTSIGSGALRASHGAVINRRTVFPTARGRVMAGESGPEAILPLSRDARGNLGVGGGGMTVVMNINTPDVGGFRRSQRQIVESMRRSMAGGA